MLSGAGLVLATTCCSAGGAAAAEVRQATQTRRLVPGDSYPATCTVTGEQYSTLRLSKHCCSAVVPRQCAPGDARCARSEQLLLFLIKVLRLRLWTAEITGKYPEKVADRQQSKATRWGGYPKIEYPNEKNWMSKRISKISMNNIGYPD